MNFEHIKWNDKTYNKLLKYIDNLKDADYKSFSEKLVNSSYEVKGIRVPDLKKLAKELSKSDYKSLLNLMKINTYEEVMLVFLIIASIQNYDEAIFYLKIFIKYIDSWGITDTFASSFKIVKKNKEKALTLIEELIMSNDAFSKRLGYVLLLDYYVDKEYLSLIFNYIKNEKTKNYYVQMAISWLLSVMYIKYKDETYYFLKNNNVDEFVMHKTISKINDSFRITDEDKLKAKSLLS